MHLRQRLATGVDEPLQRTLDVVAVQADVVEAEVGEARRGALLTADLEHLQTRPFTDDDHALTMDGGAPRQAELTFGLGALTRFVIGRQPVVGHLRAEPVDEKPGGGVEVGHRDTDVLDAARQKLIRLSSHALEPNEKRPYWSVLLMSKNTTNRTPMT